MVGDELFDSPKEFGGLIAVRIWAWLDAVFLIFNFVFSFHNVRSLAKGIGQLRSNPKLSFCASWLRAAYEPLGARSGRRFGGMTGGARAQGRFRVVRVRAPVIRL